MNFTEFKDTLDLMRVKRSRQEEIDELAKKENRSLSSEEQTEFQTLNRELAIMQNKLDSWKNEQVPLTKVERKAAEEVARIIRSMAQGKSVDNAGLRIENNTIFLERAEQVATTEDVSAIQPDSIHELIEPLQKALLVDRLGIKLNSNIVGTRKYPTVNNVEASIEGETTKLVGKKIAFTATTATPKRMGLSIPFSLLSLHQANIDLIGYAIRLMNQSAAQMFNKVMFATTKVTENAPTGCFVEAAKALVFNLDANTALTESDLIDMEIKVLDTNLENDGSAAYVVGVKAYGEIKKMRDPVSGEKIYQNGMINNYPVLVSNHIGANGIGFGVFSNCELNQYGAIQIVVDNLSRSKEAITEVNFNLFFDVQVVRKEAFVYGKFVTTKATTPSEPTETPTPTKASTK